MTFFPFSEFLGHFMIFMTNGRPARNYDLKPFDLSFEMYEFEFLALSWVDFFEFWKVGVYPKIPNIPFLD